MLILNTLIAFPRPPYAALTTVVPPLTLFAEDMKNWPFKVVDDNDKPRIQVDFKGETRTFAAPEIRWGCP